MSPAYPHRAAWGTAGRLRQWQQQALDSYLATKPRDFLAVATPGAGKTTFALRIAVELFGAGVITKLTVVCPTEHLKNQWAGAAARVGIHIDPSFTNSQGRAGSHFDGVAVTYAQVAKNPDVHAARTRAFPTLVIFDEIHHAGDALSWGDGVRDAFTPATRRLALTGTPFRSDTTPIPFVRYEEDERGLRRSSADYTYGYGEALRDGVVRPILFHSYSGHMEWQTSQGEQLAARLGEATTKAMEKQAWRTALDPGGRWIPEVLAAADQRLRQIRRQIPDAAGLVIASNQKAARAYAAHLREITGVEPTLVLSDDAGASERIDDFRDSDASWMVAVRMVSEGVDVPRLCVGVYATSTSTPLYFAQAVGRFVRARRRGEVASLFLPSVRPLLGLAAELETQRNHALDKVTNPDAPTIEERAMAQANATEQASASLLGEFQALQAQAEFSGVLFDGAEFGTNAEVGSLEEQEYLGIPGLLDTDQVARLLHDRQVKQLKAQRAAQKAAGQRDENARIADHRMRAAKRKELNRLVAQYSRRTGRPHAAIHAELRRRCGGPHVAQAETAQIAKRVDMVRAWFVGKTG
ncbi:DEAD/DEAH box helicase [Nanchangia anserum]|uniref:DEAD/DEAH box helicase n=1 Tax=Nanchangia anserum TaxID=2692125 RepID=A0A8I0KTT5_9ACTO|nr:DEAD/DEAH box helicase [Nanchangia anserum]MBD3688943.1 DEAD/DEAH box helicase [Nanchangia anserum]QOX82615.1 DEAD/DEAH box helicase [Nanchangia anserum]